jgi:MFS family permease
MCQAPAHAKLQVGKTAALDMRAIAALSVCNLAHFYSLCSIFSYAPFLCVDAGWVQDIDGAGFMAGLLPTMVMLGRIFTSFLWGMASDRIGGAACLQLTCASIALGNLLFGLSTSKLAALAARFVFLGAGNGWVALVGPMAKDINAERQAEVLTLIFATGPIVQMLGPAAGGFFYGLLGTTFPALPPSLIGTAFGCAAIVAIRVGLPPLPRPAHSRGTSATRDEQEGSRSPASSRDPGGSDRGECGGERTTELAEISAAGEDSCPDAAGEAITPSASPSPASRPKPLRQQRSSPSLLRLLCSHPLPLVAIVRTGSGFLLFGMFDVVPLWLAASRGAGGLALDEKQLGVILSSASLVMLPWVSYLQGKFVRRRGVRTAIRACLLTATIVYLITVPLVLAADAVAPFAGAATCVLLIAIGNAATATASTATFVATNNAAARHQEHAGAISGVQVTFEAIGKMLGPALGAPLLGALLAGLRGDHDASWSGANTTNATGGTGAAGTGAAGHERGEGGGANPFTNGASVTLCIFGVLSFLFFSAALALPRLVDGPTRSALLQGSARSDNLAAGRDEEVE